MQTFVQFISWSCDCSSIFSFVNQKLHFPTIHLQVQTCCWFWYPGIPNKWRYNQPLYKWTKQVMGNWDPNSWNCTKPLHQKTCNIFGFRTWKAVTFSPSIRTSWKARQSTPGRPGRGVAHGATVFECIFVIKYPTGSTGLVYLPIHRYWILMVYFKWYSKWKQIYHTWVLWVLGWQLF